jgi:hypothetical protein
LSGLALLIHGSIPKSTSVFRCGFMGTLPHFH